MATVDKRSRLVRAAVDLVHEQGFHNTTLAQVAAAADVPLGNVYYYFKTKEALGAAVVEDHAASQQRLRDRWTATLEPQQRLVAFVRTTAANGTQLAAHGCPVGSLCTELHKSRSALADHASSLFTAWLTWLEAQFRALGRGRASRPLAQHVLTVMEGASVLTHSLNDPGYVAREADRLIDWIAEQATVRPKR